MKFVSSPLTSPARIAAILKERGFSPRRGRGQNFLIDGNILNKILDAAELDADDEVLEIGAGLGTLTGELCRRVRRVVAVEWDRGFVEILGDLARSFSNLRVVPGDILKMDLPALLPARGKLISNLPYSVAGAILFRLLSEDTVPALLLCLVQKEVAERIASPPGPKEYGILSVLAQSRTRPEILFRVKPSCFFPRPRVESAVIRLRMGPRPENFSFFVSVVKAAFNRRRKMLKNSLAALEVVGYTAAGIEKAAAAAGIDLRARAETLSSEDFMRLSAALTSVAQCDH